MSAPHFSRRRLLMGLASGAGALALAGCDGLTQNAQVDDVLRQTEKLTLLGQRLLLGRQALAQEFSEADLSPVFRANGTQMPDSDAYARLLEHGFADWRLQVDGLVQRPQRLSLAELRRFASRTQTPGTTVSKDGAPSANGRACRSASCSTSLASGPAHAMLFSIARTSWSARSTEAAATTRAST